MLRDRLRARLDRMGAEVDYVRLAEEALGIRNAPAALARRLVSEALIVGDRRDEWTRAGARIVKAAPQAPGVYVLRDDMGIAIYVGKAINLKRRLASHFTPRRWLRLGPEMARVTQAQWHVVGSELEALLLEAEYIQSLAPKANVQVGSPSLRERQVPQALVHDVLVLLPAGDPELSALICARLTGQTLIARCRRDGSDVGSHVRQVFRFFTRPFASRGRDPKLELSPIVFSWLSGRGAAATRFDAREFESSGDIERCLASALSQRELFTERLVFRPASRQAPEV